MAATLRERVARLFRLEGKASQTAKLIAWTAHGQPVWTPRDLASLAREGFAKNAIVYRSVRMIAEAAGSVPLFLFDGEAEVDAHPLLELLAKPSPALCTPDLIEAWYGHLLVAGNAYLEAVSIGGTVRELHVLRPDRMKLVPGADGWPEAYDYTVGGQTVRFHQDVGAGVRPILHMALFHPLNDHYGMSPLEPAGAAIDIHNASGAWNKALLDNSACPSGARLQRQGRAAHGRAVRAAQIGARRKLPGRQECRAAAPARRRARLEGDGLLAQGHGFHLG
jgi:phage portal protein BeeE